MCRRSWKEDKRLPDRMTALRFEGGGSDATKWKKKKKGPSIGRELVQIVKWNHVRNTVRFMDGLRTTWCTECEIRCVEELPITVYNKLDQ